MFFAQHFSADSQGLLVVRPGTCIVAHRLQHSTQTDEAGGGVGVLISQHFPADRQRLLVSTAGRPHSHPSLCKQYAHVVEAGGGIRMLVAQCFPADRQGLLDVRPGARIVAQSHTTLRPYVDEADGGVRDAPRPILSSGSQVLALCTVERFHNLQ